MNTQSVIEYLLEQGELIDETLEKKIDALLNDKYYSHNQIRSHLATLLERECDDFDKIAFLNKFYPELKDEAKITIKQSYAHNSTRTLD